MWDAGRWDELVMEMARLGKERNFDTFYFNAKMFVIFIGFASWLSRLL